MVFLAISYSKSCTELPFRKGTFASCTGKLQGKLTRERRRKFFTLRLNIPPLARSASTVYRSAFGLSGSIVHRAVNCTEMQLRTTFCDISKQSYYRRLPDRCLGGARTDWSIGVLLPSSRGFRFRSCGSCVAIGQIGNKSSKKPPNRFYHSTMPLQPERTRPCHGDM